MMTKTAKSAALFWFRNSDNGKDVGLFVNFWIDTYFAGHFWNLTEDAGKEIGFPKTNHTTCSHTHTLLQPNLNSVVVGEDGSQESSPSLISAATPSRIFGKKLLNSSYEIYGSIDNDFGFGTPSYYLELGLKLGSSDFGILIWG
ncbi:unnamed protein product [Fraxinus pennsylvanica]|uniref:Uncharacterized protein n=1 Tax=Fraxinus pennsylvanica TaxID=56036 RepID=A0AAD1YWV6_9LAMI|nr:unnamed protein product [Fraxinus pennsylvanica]